METLRFGDYPLSRMMLGTVQFGMSYGIANRSGQPQYADIVRMLAVAAEAGVNCLDTAAAYGESEEVLGKAMAELGIANHMFVATKVIALPDELSMSEADAKIEESVVQSLRKLRLHCLPMCLFHRERNCVYMDSLLRLKDKGLVHHVGTSICETPEETKQLWTPSLLDGIQIPASVLDRRFEKAGIVATMASKGGAVFTRSTYLQGLLLLSDDDTPSALAVVNPVRARLKELARETGITLAELALRFMLGRSGISSVIVGVETLEQLQSNLSLFENGPLDSDLSARVEATVTELSNDVLMPNKWPSR